MILKIVSYTILKIIVVLETIIIPFFLLLVFLKFVIDVFYEATSVMYRETIHYLPVFLIIFFGVSTSRELVMVFIQGEVLRDLMKGYVD